MDDDERLARELQEQWDKEYNDHQEKQKNQTNLNTTITTEKQQESSEYVLTEDNDNLLDLAQQQQAEWDMMMAMKLQEELYAQEFSNKPPPPPTSYVPLPPQPTFIRQHKEDTLPPTPECIKRITSDIKEILQSKSRFIFVSPDEDDITHIQALIVGPPDTPYAFGFFHFDMLFPHDYPWRPPKVQIITTDSGRVRFNPNLYSNGKVCLSILGTWQGPGWTQIQTILSTLLSIQSLMNPAPYHNEPGFESERNPGDVERYNQCITHETLRVAVCGMLEDPTCGELWKEELEELFLEHFDEYEAKCLQLMDQYDGKPMKDPFGESRGSFKYKSILSRLRSLKEKIQNKSTTTTTTTTSTTVAADEVPETTATTTTATSMDVEAQTNGFTEQPPAIEQPTTETASTPMQVEEAKPTIATSSSSDLEKKAALLTEQLQSVLTTALSQDKISQLDEEFAKALQEQEYSTSNSYKKPGWKPYNYYQQSYTANSPPKNYTPVKGVKLSELAAETETTKEKDYDPDIICLVCHQSPKEYIVLPNCQSPHIYCMTCASKMINAPSANPNYYMPGRGRGKRGGANAQTITCVLCSCVSNLDPVSGLSSLRRRKRRKTEEKGNFCAEHSEEFCMYCLDCQELICFVCASSSHSKHNTEALDVAQRQISSNVQKQVATLQIKREKLESFVKEVQKQRASIPNAVEIALKDTKEKFMQLRKLLDDKEKEMEEAIKRMESSRNHTIDTEIKKASDRIGQIDQSLSSVTDTMSEQEPLVFLQKMEDAEEQVRHCSLLAEPEVKSKWFDVPQLNVLFLEQAMKALKYKDTKHHNLQYFPGFDNSYEEEEDDYSEEPVAEDLY